MDPENEIPSQNPSLCDKKKKRKKHGKNLNSEATHDCSQDDFLKKDTPEPPPPTSQEAEKTKENRRKKRDKSADHQTTSSEPAEDAISRKVGSKKKVKESDGREMETPDNDTSLNVPENPEGNVSSRKESRKRKAELKTSENVSSSLDNNKVGDTSLEPVDSVTNTTKKMKKKKAKAGNTEEPVADGTSRDGEEKKKMKKKKAKIGGNVAEAGVELVTDDGASRDEEEKKNETNPSFSVETAIVDSEMVHTDGDAKKSDSLSNKKKGKKKQKTTKSCDVESSEAGETIIDPEAVDASRDGDVMKETESRNDPGAEIVPQEKKKKIRKSTKKTRGDDGEATKVDTETASLVHTKAEDTSTELAADGTSRDGEEKEKETICISALGTETAGSDCAGLVTMDTDDTLARKKIKKRKNTESGDVETTAVDNRNAEPGSDVAAGTKKKKSKREKKAKTSENLESATVDNERTLIVNNTAEDRICLDAEANVDQTMGSKKLVSESLANTDMDKENQNVSTLEPRETEEDVPLDCPIDTERKKRNRKKKKVQATGNNVCESKEELCVSPQDAITDIVMVENMDSIQSSEKPSKGKLVAENPSEEDNIGSVAESSGLNCDSIKESSPAIVEQTAVLIEANNSSLKRLNHDSEADGSVVEKEIVTYKRKKSRDSMDASKSSEEIDSVIKQVDELPSEKELEETILVRSLVPRSRKKLLILDVNGILVDFVEGNNTQHKPDIRISGKDVFKRPYCDEFLEFCFERFTVAVWTSRLKRNMEKVIDFLFGESQKKLLFSWDRSQCTMTGFNTIENRWKPLVLKELKKVWDKIEPDLPYEKGDYDETNTLLVDDSPYKAIRNPVNTAIFPREYRFTDRRDEVLGPGGALRAYLEGLVSAKNVQKYVNRYPFGLPSITKSHRSWDFYERVIKAMERQSKS